MARLLVALTVVTCLAAAAAAQEKKPDAGSAGKPATQAKSPADDGAKRDLAMVQGTWEHEMRDRDGKVRGRLIKHVQGNKEMVIQEGAEGKVTAAWRADFEVFRAHGVRLFRFRDLEVLEGPNKGRKMSGPHVYVYRITEDAFTEVMGFMIGQEEQAISARVYKRVKEQPEVKEGSQPKPKEPAEPKDEP